MRLIHYTVQEYLYNHPSFFSKPHSILAETCLTYLNSRQVKNLTSNSPLDYGRMPFLKYSARYWGTHTTKDLTDNARPLALKFLNQYEDHISAVSLLEQAPYSRYIRGIATPPLFSGLHCASFFGIAELVSALVHAKGYWADRQDCTGSTPFAWAVRNGHVGVVTILLEQKNVDPDRLDMRNRTPLGWAAIMGHGAVVKILLQWGNVDPGSPIAQILMV